MNNNTKKIIVQEVKEWDKTKVKVSRLIVQGKYYAEGIYMYNRVKPHILKLSKEKYVIINSKVNDGEVRYFNNSNTEKTVKNIRKSHVELKRLIRTNFELQSDKQLFLTLTYQENMMDKDRLYSDYKKFWQRFKYSLPEHTLEYIYVAEPQGRGAWHIHAMIKSDQQLFTGYTKNEIPQFIFTLKSIREMWKGAINGNGSTRLEKLSTDGDDLGSYFGSYFTSKCDTEENILTDEEIYNTLDEKEKKKFVKGKRLNLYPPYFKFYRCSRGIERPETLENVPYDKTIEYLGEPTYSKTMAVTEIDNDSENDTSITYNTIHKATFKEKK